MNVLNIGSSSGDVAEPPGPRRAAGPVLPSHEEKDTPGRVRAQLS